LSGGALILNGATDSDRSGTEADQGLIHGGEINVPDQEGGFEIGFSPVDVPDQGEAIPEENLGPEEALRGEEVGRGADPEDEVFVVGHYREGLPEGREVVREVGETDLVREVGEKDLVREVGEIDLVESVEEDHLSEKLSPASPKTQLHRLKMSRTQSKMRRTRLKMSRTQSKMRRTRLKMNQTRSNCRLRGEISSYQQRKISRVPKRLTHKEIWICLSQLSLP